MSLSVTYLGLPLHYNKASYSDWTLVLGKLTTKLDTWKAKYLSIGGPLTLLNSILSAIPTYFLTVLHLPKKVELEIDRICRHFLWKSKSTSQAGFHLVKWQNICRNKEQDGLGIINIRNFSVALKCKLLWQLLANTLCLKWPALVISRYFSLNNFGTLLNVTSYWTSPLWQELRKCFPIVNLLTSFSLNDGKKLSPGKINR